MPDEYAVLRWETEGGASRDRSEPLQENEEAAKGGKVPQRDSLRRRPARLCS
jgi:hypothetical protein